MTGLILIYLCSVERSLPLPVSLLPGQNQTVLLRFPRQVAVYRGNHTISIVKAAANPAVNLLW